MKNSSQSLSSDKKSELYSQGITFIHLINMKAHYIFNLGEISKELAMSSDKQLDDILFAEDISDFPVQDPELNKKGVYSYSVPKNVEKQLDADWCPYSNPGNHDSHKVGFECLILA